MSDTSDMSDTPPEGTPPVPAGDEPTRLDHEPIVVPPPTPPGAAGPSGGPDGGPPEEPPVVGEPGEGRSPWPWVIGGLAALLAVVALLLLLTGDDDGDDDVGLEPLPGETTTTTSTTTTSTTTTTAPPATTTAPPATTTTAESPPVTADPAQCEEAGADPEAPEPAAQAVFIAWTRGDENCAAQLMTPAARVELFSRDGSQATDVFQGCDQVDAPDPHTDCAFTYEGGATHYLMNFSDTDGWTVFDITQFAD